jgi:uncharacterized protein YqjF (DUF2071 family)
MSAPKKQFLAAQWINLLMLNYEVDPEILRSYIPPGTELDLWKGKALVSMVGFLFQNTRVWGIQWPLHVNFEEVNLRFYVKHFDGREWKRGAVFINELVPKPLIATIANVLYKEHYKAMPMRHSINQLDDNKTRYLYEWHSDGKWDGKLGGTVSNKLSPIAPDSAEEFIFEHYWGYNKVGKKKTNEYQVEHVRWNAGQVIDPIFEADITHLYGAKFEPFLKKKPYSAFFADGSDVIVRAAGKIRAVPELPK